jgi:P-type conjugative transfer protein TrbJ
MTNSSGAVGSLQAQQTGNELLALQVKQSLQAQALVATQARAEALRTVEQQVSAEAARERFTRFIGDGHAYPGKK